MAHFVIAGATGATGRRLVAHAVACDDVARVTALLRRKRTKDDDMADVWLHEKVQQVEIDYEKLETADAADVAWLDAAALPTAAFCCLGISRKKAGSAAAYRRVDYDYCAFFARLVHQAGVKQCYLISTAGASASSAFLYPKTKGEIENYYQSLKFDRLSIYRPGILDKGSETRTVSKFFGMIMGSLAVDVLAQALAYDALVLAKTDGTDSAKLFKVNADIVKYAAAWAKRNGGGGGGSGGGGGGAAGAASGGDGAASAAAGGGDDEVGGDDDEKDDEHGDK